MSELTLEAIGQMMDEKLAQQKEDILRAVDEKLAQQNREVMVLLESDVGPKFELLKEGQQAILEKLVPRSRVDDLEEEVKFLKAIIRQINEDVQELKKAQ